MPAVNPEDQWIAIQQKTFVNWTNEQLSIGRRHIQDISSDFCDGVCLVALVEALQLRKIGKVYAKPDSYIHKMHNVSLALDAIRGDRVKLVNIGTDDIVSGNLKLILGLVWHLILRYQLNDSPQTTNSTSSGAVKRLMLSWFKSILPDLNITNFTSSWTDGRALHALLDYCKPGLVPNWRQLDSQDKADNCRRAMQLAKDELNIPKVISPEDFASTKLDELSAMTYLSYFTRKNSPGYYGTLNWLCRQLKTTNITNLTSDWNSGQYLCALVQSMGGQVPGWPDKVDTSDHLSVCQLGISSAQTMGIEPTLSAAELSSPQLDHLVLMTYLAQFQTLTSSPRNEVKAKMNSVHMTCENHSVRLGQPVTFHLRLSDPSMDKSSLSIKVNGPPSGNPSCDLSWSTEATATCTVKVKSAGTYKIHVDCECATVHGSPLAITVTLDPSIVQFKGHLNPVKLGQTYSIEVPCPAEFQDSIKIKAISPSGQDSTLDLTQSDQGLTTSFQPNYVGAWAIHLCVGGQQQTEEILQVFDNTRALLKAPPHTATVGRDVSLQVDVKQCGSKEVFAQIQDSDGQDLHDVTVSGRNDLQTVTFTPKNTGIHMININVHGQPVNGSPLTLEVLDPATIEVRGEGLNRCPVGAEAYFTVDSQGMPGDLTVSVEVHGQTIPVQKNVQASGICEFRYIPPTVGVYQTVVRWNGEHVQGSPYRVEVTDKHEVVSLDHLDDLKDEIDHIALACDTPFVLAYDVSKAGPGTFKAEVLCPDGRIPVTVNQGNGKATVTFTANTEGDHYIHLYWSDSPLVESPLLCYCPGPPLPVDASQVSVEGQGAESARATVPAHFVIDGRRAGPGVPQVVLQGIQSSVPVQVTPLKYDRYRCQYTSQQPGSFLLYINWSREQLPVCPLKVNVTMKGDASKVKVTGEGLRGGIVGHELKLFVDATNAGPGVVNAQCNCARDPVRCDVKEAAPGQYTVRILPTQPEKHLLDIWFDGDHIKGSPFSLRIGEPPDPSKVVVLGPGVQDGLLDWFESRFLVQTHGAGAGQLAVKIRGPRGGFKVDMRRESNSERTITCRFDPSEPGEYHIHIRWSGVHVTGSPFTVHLVETQEELWALREKAGHGNGDGNEGIWSADV